MRMNRKMCQVIDDDGSLAPRVSYNKKLHRFLVRCGCCEQSVEIYALSIHNNPADDSWIEINGVLTSWREWKRVIEDIIEMEKSNES